MPRSYLPVPEPYVLWRDNPWTDEKGKRHQGRYHVAIVANLHDWWTADRVHDPIMLHDWYHEVEPGRTFRDRTAALTWLYTKIEKEASTQDAKP